MKNSNTPRFALAAAISAAAISSFATSFAQTESRKPIVITAPAVKDGSNSSHAPFVAARQFDDVKSPDGQAIDKNVAPNSAATNSEPAVPAAKVAVMQHTTDAGSLPTGRTSMALAPSFDTVTVVPAIRAGTFESRDQVLADVDARLKACDMAISTMRSSSSAMSDSGRTQFNAADEQVKASEKALRKSLKAARKASATEWDAARAQLAADYEAHGLALASVDAAGMAH